MSTTETELVGVTFPLKWLKKIDELTANNPMENRQDFIREAVKEKLTKVKQ
jgi:metal-responsive CopG/Arc/MetJ family transcriptional regulator